MASEEIMVKAVKKNSNKYIGWRICMDKTVLTCLLFGS